MPAPFRRPAALAAAILAVLAWVVPACPAAERKVVVYYFHTAYRCPTCRTLERLSREAVSEGFAAELADGRLAFRSVDVTRPEDRHFVDDFRLYTKSLVLVEEGGPAPRWKNLARIWDLVREPAAFKHYVQQEVRTFLSKAGGSGGRP
nr:nitrophenyl compound nitroreductase subunit ArsF family protein [Dissulfurirhabdus thermomarina]